MTALALLSLVLSTVAVLPAAALPVPPGNLGGFEADGNFAVNTSGNVDWLSGDVETFTVIDPNANDNAFQGSSKEEDPGDWVCQAKDGGVTPGKDNLLRAYVHELRLVDGKPYVDFAVVKQTGEGDTHVNIEFNKLGQVSVDPLNGPCPHTRSAGDFLIAFDYGGTSNVTADVRLFTWDAVNTEWDPVTTGFDARAANNPADIADDPLTTGTDVVPARTFQEATVRLPDGFVACPGFATVNIRSRSSESITSALQDKMPEAAVDLSTCGSVKIKKVDDKGAPLAGATFGLFDNANATGTPVKTCVSGADGFCTFTQVVPGTYWIKEVAAPAGYTPSTHIEQVTVATRQDVTVAYQWVDPLKLGSVKIIKKDSLGNPVEGVKFVLKQDGVIAKKRDGTNAECTTAANGTCTITGLVPGVYTVHEESGWPADMTPAPDQQVTVVAETTVEVTFTNPVKPLSIGISKLVNGAESTKVHAGDGLTYSLVITNTGQVELTITSLTDVAGGQTVADLGTCAALVGTKLAPGASTASCTYTATAVNDITNTATVIGTDRFGRTANASDTASVDVLKPAISIVKKVDGQDEVTKHEGDAATYSITVKNTGDTPLTITSLSDDRIADLPAACDAIVSQTPLAVGAERSCTYPGTAPAGGVTNTASVTGVDELGGPKGTVTASDSAVVKVINPSISIVKTVNDADSVLAHEGDSLTYKLVITNTGDTPLTLIDLDDVIGATPVNIGTACTNLIGAVLAAGGSTSCTYAGTAPAGDAVNTATVKGTDALGKEVTASDTASVDVIHPAIAIEKLVEGQPSVQTHSGDQVTYSLKVTNTGDTALEITALTDDKVNLSATGCASIVGQTLAAGAWLTCQYTASPASDVTNTATVTGEDVLGGAKGTVTASDSAVVDVVTPAIGIVKVVNGAKSATVHAGDTVTYRLTITNAGDVALTIDSLVDDQVADLPATCDDLVGDTLLPGASVQCTYDVVVGTADIHNVATVNATDALGGDKGKVSDSDFADVDVLNPAIEIVKTVNGGDSDTVHAGDALEYQLVVTVRGDTPLTITALTDLANGQSITLPDDCLDKLDQVYAVGTGFTCTYTLTAGTDDIDNVATVVGEDELGKTVSDDDNASVDVLNPAIQITKLVNGEDFVLAHAGDELTYTLAIDNVGDAPLTITSLTDDQYDLPEECTDLVGQTIAPDDEPLTCTYKVTAGTDDVLNTAAVAGEDELEKTVTDDDGAFVDVLNPAIEIKKYVNGDAEGVTVHAGDTLTYVLEITNTGDATLSIREIDDRANGVEVTDLGTCAALLRTTLEPGDSVECTYAATASKDVTNVATVTAVDALEKPVDDEDDASVDVLKPGISITKKVNGDDEGVTVHEGDALTYTLEITNTGDTPLEITDLGDEANGVAVTDLGTCAALLRTTLGVEDSITCTYTATAPADDVHNVATVEGTDELGGDKGTVTDSDDADVDVINPAISIEKTVNGQPFVVVHAGDTLTYVLEITNTGDTPLLLTDLDDVANGSGVTLPEECTDLVGETLDPEDSVTCTYTTTAGAADVTNVATVNGEDRLEEEVTSSDTATVDVLNPAITIVKTVNGQSSVVVHAGDALTYKLVITNTGDAPLTLTSLADVANGTGVTLPSACTGLVGTVLAVGASVECVYTTTAGIGDVTNVATVGGEDELGKTVTASDDATVDVINPAIAIVKTGNPASVEGSSGTVTFTYVVTNTGDTPLTNVVVTDDILGPIGTVASLAPGQSVTLTKTATVSSAAPRNVGTVSGTDQLGKKVSASDDESITFVLAAAPPPRPAPQPELPRTGVELGRHVQIGLLLIVLGGLALIPARRRLAR